MLNISVYFSYSRLNLDDVPVEFVLQQSTIIAKLILIICSLNNKYVRIVPYFYSEAKVSFFPVI